MKRALVALLFLTLAAAPAAADQKLKLRGIKGDDDRLRVSSRQAPWNAIGRVNKRIGGFCTGTLIHPRVVLTAAHCLWNGRTRRFLPPVSLIFVAGYRGGEWLAHAPAKRLVVAPKYDAKTALSATTLQHDWALVELARPIAAGIAPLPLAPELPLDRPRTQAGYSQDKAHVLTVHRNCRMLGETKGARLLAHACDAVPGDSGSPILHESDGTYRVSAIHVATVRRQRTYGLAVPVAAFRAAAERLIAGLGTLSK